MGYSSCLTPLSQHPDHHRGRGSRATVSSSGWNAARSLRARPPQDQVHTVGGSGLMQTAMPQRAGGWERLGFHKLPWGTDSGGACRDLCVTSLIFCRPATALPRPLLQERKAADRAERPCKSQELPGLAQFLGKHQAPRVPGSHFHSLKLLWGRLCLSTASPGLQEASWGQQGGAAGLQAPAGSLWSVLGDSPPTPQQDPDQEGLSPDQVRESQHPHFTRKPRSWASAGGGGGARPRATRGPLSAWSCTQVTCPPGSRHPTRPRDTGGT